MIQTSKAEILIVLVRKNWEMHLAVGKPPPLRYRQLLYIRVWTNAAPRFCNIMKLWLKSMYYGLRPNGPR